MIEYRTVGGGTVGADGGLTGLVTPFGVETVIGDLKRGGFREEIAPGTFTKTLNERAVVLIHDHDTGKPMASTAVPEGQEGHLSLTQEGDGLRASAPQPIDTTYTNDVRKLAKAGILGMSFGFEVTKDDWFDDQGRASNPQVGTKRVIREVKLFECTTTAFPAYGSTMGTVSARDSINAARGTLFCTVCDALIDADTRSAHVCESRSDSKETRTVSAEVDAALDAAFKEIEGLDRNALPAEVNQFIDLASAALKLASGDLKDSGTPDPDNPNGNDYSEAGSATSVDDDERADMALLAAQFRIEAEF